MTRSLLHAGWLLLCLVAQPSLAADPPKSVSSPIAKVALDAGYTEIPLRRGCSEMKLWTTLTLGDQKLKMFLDTGAGPTTLTTQAAKRLKLTLEKPPDGSLIAGVLGEHKVSLAVIEGASVGPVPVPPSKVVVGDIAPLLKDNDPDAADGDGVLGIDFFRYFAAVIDCDLPALYIISPVRKAWPILKGTWVLEEFQVDGNTTLLDRPSAHRMTFESTEGKVTVRPDQETLEPVRAEVQFLKFDARTGVVLLPEKDQKNKSPLPFSLGVIDVQADTLRVCVCRDLKGDESDLVNLPKAFEAKKGSGHVLYTFKRVKAEKK
jgi:hypothetical protein